MHPADPMSRPVTIAEVAQLLDERMARQDRAALTTAYHFERDLKAVAFDAELHVERIGDVLIVQRREIIDKANRLLDRHDQSSSEQRAADALRDLMDALPAGMQTSMMVFLPEVNGQKVGTVKALLMAENADDLRCAQSVITQGAAKRGEGDE